MRAREPLLTGMGEPDGGLFQAQRVGEEMPWP